eukprot:4789250-Pleurochrysis_carterae.AAC.1
MPSGAARERSCGACATEKNAHGGVAKTASNRRSRTRRSTSSATSVRARPWSRPPMRVSITTTSAPRALSSDESVEAAESSPAKATRTRGRSPPGASRAATGA